MTTTTPQLSLAVASLGLVIATAVSSSNSKSLALFLLLPEIFVFSASSAFLERRVHKHADNNEALLILVDNRLRPTGANLLLIIAPSISLSILLFVRILCVEHFLTDPAALDFGPKEGDPCKPNVAFAPEFNSFGHYIQGIVAALFAYPAVGEVLARCCRERPLAPPRPWFLLLAEFVAFAFTFYPAYNFVKRTIKNADTFATSSYMNNGCEWAMGALVGMSLGMLMSSAMLRATMVKLRQRERPQRLRDDDGRGVHGYLARLCLGVARLFGVFFLISVFGAAAMAGITWNSCADGATDCANYSPVQAPIGVIVGLVLIPTVVCGFALVIAIRGSVKP